ncbi:MAG: B12-binding domain-containing protein, partial [Acidimicrobiia bacterium]
MTGGVPTGTLGLDEVARRLGVHYMTVYRYVRTGRLPARKVGSVWRVEPGDLDALRPPPGAGGPVVPGTGDAAVPAASGARGRNGGTRRQRQLEARLVAGDESGAWQVIDDAMAGGVPPDRVLLEILVPAMARIGSRWSAGDATVADEHCATAVAQRLVSRVGARLRRPGRSRGTVVVGSAPGDRHNLVVSILADVLRGAGYEVVDLGADPLPESFAERAASSDRVVAVVVGLVVPAHLEGLRAAVHQVRRVSSVAVVAGGSGLGRHDLRDLDGVHVVVSADAL